MTALNAGKSKYWCFTINSTWNLDALDNVKNWCYLVAGREVCPETRRKHLQCFVVYNVRTAFSTVKRQLPTAHIEKMMGTPQEASDYCKKDGDFEEFGKLPDYTGGASGGRKKAINYKSIIQLAEDHDFATLKENHPGEYFRHYHTIKRIAMDNPKPVEALDELKHEWIWGKSGLGKSYTARQENPGLYIKSHNKWWLGYKGESAVLIDDLSKTEAAWFGEHLKQWCDHYPFPAETKGDGMVIRPEKIIVTSNYTIEELWGHDENLCEAITRRFKVRHFVQPFQAPKKPAPVPIQVLVPPADFADHSAQSEDDASYDDIVLVNNDDDNGSQSFPVIIEDSDEDSFID
jgi:hypothetical protein